MMILIFIISIAVLLLCIMKFKLNPFVALIAVAALTGIATGMPLATQTLEDGTQILGIGTVIQNNFGSTLGSIGMVTGLGVMLGMFMYESGGINNICNTILRTLGENKSQYAVSCAGFITGIPVFGDVVYIMFAPMLRALSKKTGYSMASYACAISVATTATFALVLPTAPPLAVAANMNINVGLFFPYAIISAFVGTMAGGIIWGGIVNKIDHKNGKTWDFSDLEEEDQDMGDKSMSGMLALSILLVPIVLILLGSFSSFFLSEGTLLTVLTFLGDKNIAMLIGVLYGAFISRPYLKRSITAIMAEGADTVGSILLITGAGGAYGGILKACGISDIITSTLMDFHMPVLLMCFVISQVLRVATGSTTTALTVTSSIVATAVSSSGVSPILCAIAVCAGGMGLSLPNDSGFWAINRFFHIDFRDTIIGWTLGAFVSGLAVLIFVSILSIFQGILPGLI